MADGWARFNRDLQGFQRELTDDAVSHALGKMAKDDATQAASADLGGDPKFSGWAPTLDTRYDILGRGRVLLKPTRRSAGPWTVAEHGRNQTAGPRLVGPRYTKTGRISRARVRRYNGRTQPKFTATEALARIDKDAPGVVDKQVKAAVRKFFR